MSAKMVLRLTVVVLAVVGLSATVKAETVGLQWDSVANATGYRVSFGTQSGVYTQTRDAGNQATLDIPNLNAGQEYFFSVQAYNSVGFSGYSSEVSWTIPAVTATGPLREGIDLNGDRLADILAVNPTNGAWSIQYASGNGRFNNGPAGGWAPGWQISPADFDGNGLTDFLLYNSDSGLFYRVINNGAGNFSYYSGGWSPGWTVKILALNGDGLSDVCLYNRATGVWFRCIGSALVANGFSYSGGGWAAGWDLYVARFNGDTRDDLFLHS